MIIYKIFPPDRPSYFGMVEKSLMAYLPEKCYTYARRDLGFIRMLVEYHPACWVNENRLAVGEMI